MRSRCHQDVILKHINVLKTSALVDHEVPHIPKIIGRRNTVGSLENSGSAIDTGSDGSALDDGPEGEGPANENTSQMDTGDSDLGYDNHLNSDVAEGAQSYAAPAGGASSDLRVSRGNAHHWQRPRRQIE